MERNVSAHIVNGEKVEVHLGLPCVEESAFHAEFQIVANNPWEGKPLAFRWVIVFILNAASLEGRPRFWCLARKENERHCLRS